MNKNEFELMLQKEEFKIKELQEVFDHVLKSKLVENVSNHNTSLLNKYNLKFKLYEPEKIEDKIEGSKNKIYKKIILCWIISIIITICLIIFIKNKISENGLKNKISENGLKNKKNKLKN